MPPGGYAERRNLPGTRVAKIPDAISDRVAGSVMLRGLTAHMLLHKIYPLQSGAFVLVHAAAGGLGQLLTRWAKRLGATVIATVGSQIKVRPAEEAGADLVFPLANELVGIAFNRRRIVRDIGNRLGARAAREEERKYCG